jgi:fructose-1,6-bisphosphatase I
MSKQLITLERHLLEQQVQDDRITASLTQVLYDINLAAKVIRKEVITAGLHGMTGAVGTTNIQGESVQKLDVFANDCLKDILTAHGRIAVMASEEEDGVVTCDNETAEYAVLFDPLDGSSNIDVNVSVGTIFSVFKTLRPDSTSAEDCLQKGTEQVAAGYIIYGSSVVMVYTAGNGVHGFTYDPSIGDFLLSHPDIKIPDNDKYYSMNEGNTVDLHDGTKAFIDYAKALTAEREKAISARYVGSMVADFHRNLLKGGIFIYPGTKKNPNGKLRLMYEANPMAFICEQAGGLASDGKQRILDIEPTELHQRTPLYIGSKTLVEKALAFEKVTA